MMLQIGRPYNRLHETHHDQKAYRKKLCTITFQLGTMSIIPARRNLLRSIMSSRSARATE